MVDLDECDTEPQEKESQETKERDEFIFVGERIKIFSYYWQS